MSEVTEQVLLARPVKDKTAHSTEKNMFASLRSSERLPSLSKIKGKQYHVVGPKQLRNKVLEPEEKQKDKAEEKHLSQQNIQNLQNQTGGFSQTFMNTTINRQTIVSKYNKDQQNVLSRDTNKLNRYKQYKSFWDEESNKLKKQTLRKPGQKTLLQTNVKGLYVHENQQKLDVINNFVVNYWQMSLRNNNHILKRHIKGNKFGEVELEEMLQTNKGIKAVENSIPVLPVEKLKQTEKRNLSLTGRSKAMSETNNFNSKRFSNSQNKNQEEVFKVNYIGDLKWMSTQGL